MLDEEPLRNAGQDLLAAYRAHTGPSPEAVERLAAALRHDIAANADAPPRPAPDPSFTRAPAEIVDITARVRRRWTLGLGMLAVAAGLGMLALRPSLTQQVAQRDDPAAAFHAEPGAAGSAHARAPAVTTDAAPEAAAPGPAPSPRPAELTRPRALPGSVDPVGSAAEPPREPSLAEEMQHMRPAQLALGAGDPQRALELLEVYARTFPGGRLYEEYLALRAIALCSAGPAPAGRAEASSFLAERPRSMLAERVRGACDPPSRAPNRGG